MERKEAETEGKGKGTKRTENKRREGGKAGGEREEDELKKKGNKGTRNERWGRKGSQPHYLLRVAGKLASRMTRGAKRSILLALRSTCKCEHFAL